MAWNLNTFALVSDCISTAYLSRPWIMQYHGLGVTSVKSKVTEILLKGFRVQSPPGFAGRIRSL